ncbi:MAG: hypothetical protein J6B29_01195 [Clostridia bacterium]|nr:hypothetical protein [Clostridia bacterium]
MKEIFKRILFGKGILVGCDESLFSFEALFSLAHHFGIRITRGQELASLDVVKDAGMYLGENVPAPFYIGFPQSVKALSKEELLFDQLLHYYATYGGWGGAASNHSVFEEEFERIAFNEDVVVKDFVIVTEDEAEDKIKEIVSDMLLGTRPLNDMQYQLLLQLITTYGYKIEKCGCKATIVRLLVDTKMLYLADMLSLSDVIKLVERINFEEYRNPRMNKLNFKNRTRKFITKVIDRIFERGDCQFTECFEKKAIWCGLLHHIHYTAKNETAKKFLELIRGNDNLSVYSAFEKALAEGDIKRATDVLVKGKGTGALLRSLNYIVSRSKTDEDIKYVIDSIGKVNPIILMQLLLQYENYTDDARDFVFFRFELLKSYRETPEEVERRKSKLTPQQVERLRQEIRSILENQLKGKLGKVYIDDKMAHIAVPINESSSNSGYGVLPKGSRIHIDEWKKIRAFTYWKQVDDIDLSVMGVCSDGTEREFSWRTMASKQSDALTFSGDQTNGYFGGSEYFDLDMEQFEKMYPDIDYVVFCDNVYSGITFSQTECKAGFMIRDVEDTGNIYEPVTLESAFDVTCESTFAFLFALDIKKHDFLWLNAGKNSTSRIAYGRGASSAIKPYIKMTEILNLKTVFEMLATEIVSDPYEADVIVSNEAYDVDESVIQIHSCDIEKITAIIAK